MSRQFLPVKQFSLPLFPMGKEVKTVALRITVLRFSVLYFFSAFLAWRMAMMRFISL